MNHLFGISSLHEVSRAWSPPSPKIELFKNWACSIHAAASFLGVLDPFHLVI